MFDLGRGPLVRAELLQRRFGCCSDEFKRSQVPPAVIIHNTCLLFVVQLTITAGHESKRYRSPHYFDMFPIEYTLFPLELRARCASPGRKKFNSAIILGAPQKFLASNSLIPVCSQSTVTSILAWSWQMEISDSAYTISIWGSVCSKKIENEYRIRAAREWSAFI